MSKPIEVYDNGYLLSYISVNGWYRVRVIRISMVPLTIIYMYNWSLTYYHSTTVCIAGMHGDISRDLPSLYVTIIERVERVLQCFYCTMEHVTPMLSVGGCV